MWSLEASQLAMHNSEAQSWERLLVHQRREAFLKEAVAMPTWIRTTNSRRTWPMMRWSRSRMSTSCRARMYTSCMQSSTRLWTLPIRKSLSKKSSTAVSALTTTVTICNETSESLPTTSSVTLTTSKTSTSTSSMLYCRQWVFTPRTRRCQTSPGSNFSEWRP